MRVGLVGYASQTGLGIENHRLWRNLPIDKWLIIPHTVLGLAGLPSIAPRPETQTYVYHDDPQVLHEFLFDLDVLIAVERTYPSDIFRQAKQRRPTVRCILCVNPEWFDPSRPYFQDADLLITRTELARETLRAAGRDSTYIPCPLDLAELPFQVRHRAERFLFSNGYGGCHDRKGWPQIAAVLRRDPTALTVRTQVPLVPIDGARILGAVSEPAALYEGFDMAVQPSRFEGVGLGILEAMAVGLPVITTDASPMRDYLLQAYGPPARELLVPATRHVFQMWREQMGHVVDADALHAAIRRWRDANITAYSLAGRVYVEERHGAAAWAALWVAMTGNHDLLPHR